MEIDIPSLDDVTFDEESCPECFGKGTYIGLGKRAKLTNCHRCGGTGTTYNPVGDRLKEFLKKHYGLVPKGKDV